MKVRQGFVSNSSSSSFCILGFTAKDGEEIGYNKSELLRDENAISEWDDTRYIGAWPESMKDDETLLQFKTRIIEELKKFGIEREVKDLGWITDGGYNG